MTAVPNSTGTAPPRHPVPPGACDSHLHVLDARFPGAALTSGMTLADYRLLQHRLGTSRAVLVQAKHHGTDPAALLDALAQLGPDGRGIAVLPPDTPEAEFRRLDTGGVRGLRLSLWNPADAPLAMADIPALAARVAPLGWHLQLHLMADQIAAAAGMLADLPCPLVFDHMARLPPDAGPDHPAFAVVARLLQAGRAWVKLSGAYLNTRAGPPYSDAGRIAHAFVAEAPERLVWGSDWPHVTKVHKPDDAELLDLLAEWAGPRLADRILADNPATLYGFA
ncbi:amidohydrolase family protein [Pararoseomonas indoligenes]|uniref:Amidohydrolase family protein n=1 Tax=Roseomonas indoligenes TaxID=2820811 RepID=A0A940N668_9PROT|nr:amidohydrolase family protein [Pararoseomonas indoligenes]MBP0494872.1 amidohydrolase family protein [Pararoseomonas indoligenes]